MGKQSNESIFEMTDFRMYVRAWARTRGRGEFRRISQELGIHTTLISQIMNKKKCLTEEQAFRLCSYMRLNQLESDYLLKLVQTERAGTHQLKATYKRHLQQLRDQANEVKYRVPEVKKLTEEDRAIFYSSWQYSLVRLLTSMQAFQTAEKIASRLDLPISRVQEILNFLVSRGLCVQFNHSYRRTEKNTHVSASSAYAVRHHQNWRNKAIALQEKLQDSDLCFTSPISLAEEDVSKVKSILLDTISEISKVVEKSNAEKIVYLGIDWIKI